MNKFSWKGVSWKNAIALAALHLAAVAALFFFTWLHLVLFLAVWFVSLCPGIGVGYHRLLTHLGFKTYKWVEYGLTVSGSLALQGAPLSWVAGHRKHHKYTEQPGLDPHTPLDGVWWSHMLWIIFRDRELNRPEHLKLYAPDLFRSKFHRFMNKLPWLPAAALGALVWGFAGFTSMLWVCLAVVFCYHSTWLVNSATHLWGTRTYDTNDNSKNNLLVALLTFGEGWHNNHHKFPVSARHGLKPAQIDLNWQFIRLLKFCHLAKDIRTV